MIAYCNVYVAVYLNINNTIYMAGYNMFQPSAPTKPLRSTSKPSTETGTVFAISCVVYMPYIHLCMYLMLCNYIATVKGPSELQSYYITIILLPLCKGQILWSLHDHDNTVLLLKENNLCIYKSIITAKVITKYPLFRVSTVCLLSE